MSPLVEQNIKNPSRVHFSPLFFFPFFNLGFYLVFSWQVRILDFLSGHLLRLLFSMDKDSIFKIVNGTFRATEEGEQLLSFGLFLPGVSSSFSKQSPLLHVTT